MLTLKASHGRWRDDKSYALCRFLGAPVIDRTQSGIIDVGLNVRSLYPIPHFDPSFNAELSELMADRARELLAARVKRGAERIVLLWSGGIDSTAALCAFLRATDGDAASRRLLHVRCSPRSVVRRCRRRRSGASRRTGQAPLSAIRRRRARSPLCTATLRAAGPLLPLGLRRAASGTVRPRLGRWVC